MYSVLAYGLGGPNPKRPPEMILSLKMGTFNSYPAALGQGFEMICLFFQLYVWLLWNAKKNPLKPQSILVQTHKSSLLIMGLHIFEVKLG